MISDSFSHLIYADSPWKQTVFHQAPIRGSHPYPLAEGLDLLRSNLLQIDIQGFMVACVGASFLVGCPRELRSVQEGSYFL